MVQEAVGPEVAQDLANALNRLISEGLPEDRINELMNTLVRPSNVQLNTVKVNTLIWQALQPSIRSQDIKMQKIHNLIMKGMVAGCGVAARLQQEAQAGSTMGQEFPNILNCLALLAAAARETNFRRREIIRPGLSPEFANLCSQATPVTTQLFGDDLAQTMRDASETSRAGSRLRGRGRGRGGRFRRAGGRRPFLGRGPGRGGSYRGRGYNNNWGRRGRGNGRSTDKKEKKEKE